MLSIFRQNTITSAFALLLVSILAKVNAIMNPPNPATLGEFNRGVFFEWKWLNTLYTQHPTVYMLLSVLAITGFAFQLNKVVNREKLFARKSYLPGLMFVLMTSLLPVFNFFSLEAIANFFIFSAFIKMSTLAGISRPRRAVFDIGLLLGLASLFYFPTVFIFLFIPFLILLFRPFLVQEFLAYFLGLITPWYLTIAWLFISGKWAKASASPYFHIHLPVQLTPLPIFISMTLFSVILGFYALYLLNKQGSRNPMQVRKKWNMMTIYIVLAMMLGSFSVYFPSTSWIIALTPFCILLSLALQNNSEKSNSFTLLSIVILLIVVQWIL